MKLIYADWVKNLKGGPGSGFHSEDGHAGIPGKQGGSRNDFSLDDKIPERFHHFYEIGVKARQEGYDTFNDQQFLHSHFWNEVENVGVFSGVFLRAGMEGKPEPYWVTGWRYGDIPKSGASYNTRDQKHEAGVSVMEVFGGEKTQDRISAEFIKTGRKVVYVKGLLNTIDVGGDGEPLLMRAIKIDPPSFVSQKGGKGSGNFGHAGRPGKIGGSSVEHISKQNFPDPIITERMPIIPIKYASANEARLALLSSIKDEMDEIDTLDKEIRNKAKEAKENINSPVFFDKYRESRGLKKKRKKISEIVDAKVFNWLVGVGVDNPAKLEIVETIPATPEDISTIKSYLSSLPPDTRISTDDAYNLLGIDKTHILHPAQKAWNDPNTDPIQRKNTETAMNLLSKYISADVLNTNRVVMSFDRTGRSFFDPSINCIAISDYGGAYRKQNDANLFHEMGHWLEHNNSDIAERTSNFLQRRTAGEKAKPWNELLPKELCKKDKFITAYVGMIYKDGETEVLSTGLAMLLSNPVKLATKDPEHFNLVLSVIRGIPEM